MSTPFEHSISISMGACAMSVSVGGGGEKKSPSVLERGTQRARPPRRPRSDARAPGRARD